MTKTYELSGIHCTGCTNAVERILGNLTGIKKVTATLEPPRATIEMDEVISLDVLNEKLKLGGYELVEIVNS